jgi:hypothetical protein
MKPESTSGTSSRAEILRSESFHSGDLVKNVSERVDGPSNLEDVKAHSTHGGADIRQSSSDVDPDWSSDSGDSFELTMAEVTAEMRESGWKFKFVTPEQMDGMEKKISASHRKLLTMS